MSVMSFSTTAVRSVAVPGLLLLLALAAALSLTIGAKSLPIGTVFTAFSGTCQSADCTIVLDARLPRTLAGLLAGIALGLAGALMQTLTRNPLADPGLLGSTPAPASLSSSARRCSGSPLHRSSCCWRFAARSAPRCWWPSLAAVAAAS